MSDWISCKERMPENEGIYITYSTKSQTVRVKKFGLINYGHKNITIKRKGFLRTAQLEDTSVTYWMPLPCPPSK